MHDYALTADLIKRWQARVMPDDPRAQLDFWFDLLEDFGPALLPFVLKPEFLPRVPYRGLGLAPIDVREIAPDLGECWLLFCFRSEETACPGSPLRGDGIMLPCEWRRSADPATGGHSALLADGLVAVAEQAKAVLDGDGWFLYPSFGRFADRIGFTDPALFAPAGCSDQAASAWGALAVGLYFVRQGRVPAAWPFSSVQVDSVSGRLLPVEGVRRKLAVAAGFRCHTFMVAPSQVASARADINALVASASDPELRARLKDMTVAAPIVSRDLAATVEDLATGTIRRKRRRTACGAVCAALLAACSVFGAWHYLMLVRPVTEYYATAFRCRDGWEGRGRMTASAAARRVGNVRFTREGLRGSVSEVAWVDGKNRPASEGDLRSLLSDLRSLEYGTLWQTRSVRVRLIYEKEGRAECAYDAYGRETYRMKFQEPGQPQAVIYTKNGWLGTSGRHNAKQIAVWYDEVGRVSTVRFLDDRNPPRPTYNFDGVAGYDVAYGPNSESVRYVDPDGMLIPSKDGCCRIDSEFDGRGRVRRISCHDARGRLTLCSRGYAVCEIDYDRNGNPSVYRYLDIHRVPVPIPTRQGSASELKVRYLPGDLASRLYERYENQGGKGKRIGVEEMRFDAYGYVSSRIVVAGSSHLDGDPSVRRVQYDRSAPNLVNSRYLDLDGDARTNDLGVAAERMELNDDGMVVRSMMLGLDGKPITSEDGVAETVNTYEGVNLVAVEGYDEYGRSLGVKVVSQFDDRNLRVSTEHMWTNGCPIVSGGYWKETFRYNTMRCVTEHAFFLPGGEPATNAEGISRTVLGYSAVDGKIIHLAYWHGTNHLVDCADGYATFTNGYDDAGNLIYEAFLNASGKVVRTKSGHLIRRMKYDSSHREIERLNVDENGKLHNDISGRSRYVTRYGVEDQNLGVTAYNEEGEPLLPLLQFREGLPESGIQVGDILLSCDQWRYERAGCDPVGLSMTNGELIAGIVVARRVNGAFSLARCPGAYAFHMSDFRECVFSAAEEERVCGLMESD